MEWKEKEKTTCQEKNPHQDVVSFMFLVLEGLASERATGSGLKLPRFVAPDLESPLAGVF